MGKSETIAKNTLLLYVRMFVTMCVGLFTSRAILNSLGIDDYGIYNVVGGVVTMFSFFTGSLSTAISRFLTFSLGKAENDKLKEIFSASMTIQIMISIIVFVVIEIIGVWFLNSSMNVPEERMEAANWVIHCSVIIFIIHLLIVPYNAAIIAHERMNTFAYISVLESFLKLGVAYSLFVSPFDKLKVYASLLVGVTLIVFFLYYIYCRKRLLECKYHFSINRCLIKEMAGFAGWNMVGNGAYMLNTHGVNILTNLYFGVPANAARGIAEQVRGIMMQFVNSFTTAINPQITKSYAEGDLNYLSELICRGAKFSFYLMLFFLVPLMFEIEFILGLWLKNYPPLAPLFLRLLIIEQMVDFLGNTTARTVWATGKVRKYYITTSMVSLLVFPLTWLLYCMNFSAEWSYIVFIAMYIVIIPIRLSIVKELIGFSPNIFYKRVIISVLSVTIVAFTVPAIMFFYIDEGTLRHVLVIVASLFSVSFAILLVGLDNEEKVFFVSILNRKIFPKR